MSFEGLGVIPQGSHALRLLLIRRQYRTNTGEIPIQGQYRNRRFFAPWASKIRRRSSEAKQKRKSRSDKQQRVMMSFLFYLHLSKMSQQAFSVAPKPLSPFSCEKRKSINEPHSDAFHLKSLGHCFVQYSE